MAPGFEPTGGDVAAGSVAYAREIRRLALEMVARAGASHIGSALSIADLLAVLYSGVLRIDPASPRAADRDRFILSKGHACVALYAALALRGFIPASWLDAYGTDGSTLAGHSDRADAPGLECATGSLGHGLPIGTGMALADRNGRYGYRVFVLMSDGECDEGSTWESALIAAHHRLERLVAIIDYNKIQSFGRVEDVIRLEPLGAKWDAFGWAVHEVDGHDHVALSAVFSEIPLRKARPTLILAHTVKGKGVSFMEDDLAWHYRSPDPAQLQAALMELSG